MALLVKCIRNHHGCLFCTPRDTLNDFPFVKAASGITRYMRACAYYLAGNHCELTYTNLNNIFSGTIASLSHSSRLGRRLDQIMF